MLSQVNRTAKKWSKYCNTIRICFFFFFFHGQNLCLQLAWDLATIHLATWPLGVGIVAKTKMLFIVVFPTPVLRFSSNNTLLLPFENVRRPDGRVGMVFFFCLWFWDIDLWMGISGRQLTVIVVFMFLWRYEVIVGSTITRVGWVSLARKFCSAAKYWSWTNGFSDLAVKYWSWTHHVIFGFS